MFRLKFDRVKLEYISSGYAEPGTAVYFDGDTLLWEAEQNAGEGTYFASVGKLLRAFSKFAVEHGEMPEPDCDGYTIVDEPV